MKHPGASLVLALSSLLAAASCAGGPGGHSEGLSLVRSLPYLEEGAPPLLGPGRAVVVEFWATWCPPCVQSVPHLVELDRRLGPEGLVLVGVHAARGANDRAGIRRFAEARDVEYPIALDVDGRAGRAFGVGGIPRAFVFDRSGRLVYEGHPMDPAFTTAVERAVSG